jgi:hypothetical protein
MQLKLLIGSSLLAAVMLTGAACEGTISDEGDFDVIGVQAELVQKKRAWITGYDRHCSVCFEAFELCEKGSVDVLDAANCEAALNACVRGGLINDGDAGANLADASSVSTELDAAIEGDVDAGGVDAGAEPRADNTLDAGDVLNADAGQREPAAVDAGRRSRGTRDSGVFVADAGPFAQDAAVDPVVTSDASIRDAASPQAVDSVSRDAGAGRARPAPNAGDKNQLEQNVVQCLSEAHDCLGTSVRVQSCVGTLRDCVRTALAQTFANVCTTQIASCRAEGAAENVTRSVERLCQQDLDFASDAAQLSDN